MQVCREAGTQILPRHGEAGDKGGGGEVSIRDKRRGREVKVRDKGGGADVGGGGEVNVIAQIQETNIYKINLNISHNGINLKFTYAHNWYRSYMLL